VRSTGQTDLCSLCNGLQGAEHVVEFRLQWNCRLGSSSNYSRPKASGKFFFTHYCPFISTYHYFPLCVPVSPPLHLSFPSSPSSLPSPYLPLSSHFLLFSFCYFPFPLLLFLSYPRLLLFLLLSALSPSPFIFLLLLLYVFPLSVSYSLSLPSPSYSVYSFWHSPFSSSYPSCILTYLLLLLPFLFNLLFLCLTLFFVLLFPSVSSYCISFSSSLLTPFSLFSFSPFLLFFFYFPFFSCSISYSPFPSYFVSSYPFAPLFPSSPTLPFLGILILFYPIFFLRLSSTLPSLPFPSFLFLFKFWHTQMRLQDRKTAR
jgi:hypothetical protein